MCVLHLCLTVLHFEQSFQEAQSAPQIGGQHCHVMCNDKDQVANISDTQCERSFPLMGRSSHPCRYAHSLDKANSDILSRASCSRIHEFVSEKRRRGQSCILLEEDASGGHGQLKFISTSRSSSHDIAEEPSRPSSLHDLTLPS